MAETAKRRPASREAAEAHDPAVARAGVTAVVSPWKPARHRRQDRDLKREAVLAMAARLFIERGYGRATLADVAESLHITKPALYHYFASKEDILLECYRLGNELVRAEINRIDAAGASGIEKLRDLIRSYARLMTTDYGAMLVRVDDRELSPEPRAQVRSWKRAVDADIQRFVREGAVDGSVRACDLRMAALVIGGSLNWIGHWRRPDGPLNPDEIGEHFADLLTRGLASATRESG